LTGTWAARHSEELRRGITIKLGYADTAIYQCRNCDEPNCYCTTNECPGCGEETEFKRAISFVDAPGHEILMATMLSGAAVMDGAILVIAADEPCPQPQTREHLAAIETVGLEKLIIVQNKIDIVSREEAVENYNQIRDFIKGSIAENAPIIPVSAQHEVNIDLLLKAMEDYLSTPDRDPEKPPRMPIIRSFDVNPPGTPIDELVGGVLGGSIIDGSFKIGEEIEIKPGLPSRQKGRVRMEELFTEIVSLHAGGSPVEEARSGGLVGVGTLLDPSITKSDGLVGSMIGKPGTLPLVRESLSLDIHLFENVVGTVEQKKVSLIANGELLLLNVGTAKTTGKVTDVAKDYAEMDLTIPVSAEKGSRVALSRRIEGRWRLIGWGVLES
jgi:translation initiation factor 2 subunit 3